MEIKKFDVIIAGGGPSGSACAICLAESGLQVALVDRAIFPRDKTCGDALSIDVVNQLSFISKDLAEQFKLLENKIPSYGIKVFSADHSSIAIPLMYKNVKGCGYVSPRLDFDNFMFQYAKKCNNIHPFENNAIGKIEQTEDGVIVTTSRLQLHAPIIIGADGAHSIVQKQLTNIEVDKEHYSGGLRVYYENVTGFDEENFIELHFFKEVIPGYLWLFPLANNKANVGIGMLSSAISKNKVNLKEELNKLITTHPKLIDRFKNAKALETVKGYGLPLGSQKRNISGARFLLTGDAAGLIDPFTGEGIANAIRSGRIAAKHVIEATKANNFSASFNKKYDKEIYDKMWKEFKISTLLQKLITYPRLCNLIVRKANSVKYIQQLLVQGLASVDKRKSILTNPKFYFKLFLSGKKNKKAA
jgi:geranylgeranyl reductase family protein